MPSKIKKIIGIVGGSISGLRTAIGLRQKGFKTTIFESAYPYQLNHHKGTGVVLPSYVIQNAISQNLFDVDIPRLPPITSQAFLTKDDSAPQQARTIFQQPFSFTPLNWSQIYANLRKRIPDEHYLASTEVTSVLQDATQCYVEAKGAHGFVFDRVILANGMASTVGKKYFPTATPNHSDSVTWKGVITDQKIATLPLFCNHSPVYLFSNGYLVFYQTPAHDYEKSHDLILNWSMHVLPKDISSKDLLSENNNPLSQERHTAYLHALAKKVLPAPISDIICQTKMPTIQPIFDFQMPNYVEKRVCLVGNSAAILRPHTISNLQCALESSERLVKALDPVDKIDINSSLLAWNNLEVTLAKKQNALSSFIGEKFIYSTAKIYSGACFKTIMDEYQCMSTSPESTETDPLVLEKRKQFTPSLDKTIENLCTSIQKVHLEEERPLSNSPRTSKGIYR